MIKLVSLVVFISAFVSTWFLFNSRDKIDFAVHAGIQSKMMILIEDAIKHARPNSSDFKIVSIYTRKVNDNQVSAHFIYQYNDQLEDKEKVSQSITGEAILNRTPSENPTDQKWVVQSVKTNNNSIEFQDGMIVNTEPAAPQTPSTPSAPPAEEKKTE